MASVTTGAKCVKGEKGEKDEKDEKDNCSKLGTNLNDPWTYPRAIVRFVI